MAREAHAEAIYLVADMFRDRCLAGESSLLWPDQPAWTLENLDAMWDAFIGQPDEGKDSFMEKWRNQLASESKDVHRIAADVMTFYYLFASNIGEDAKRKGLAEVISWRLGDEAASPVLADVHAAFSHNLGHSGIYYLTGRPWQIAYYLQFARRLKREGINPNDVDACQSLADSVRDEVAGSHAARHILLHLLFPKRYERIASGDHKRRIVAAFPEVVGEETDQDKAILKIRESLVKRLEIEHVDFYQGEVWPLWNPEPLAPDPVPVKELDRSTSAASIDELVASTHLPEMELREIEDLLLERKQIIFEGPPGSGKTYVADQFARWFVGLPLGGPPNPQLELVQFHQSYGYEDFVQGIRPETDSAGNLRYRVRDGIFKQLCEVAAGSPDRRFVLIIDEINRGNTARIFGELLLLLEYRDKRARLPYASPDAGDEGYLSIPSNLYLIGTMNSTDRSLAQVDYALRRRFYFRQFKPVEAGKAPVLDGWLTSRGVPDVERKRLLSYFVSLNARISDLLSHEYQVGHSYFMTGDIHTREGLDRAWRRSLKPLLEEYFHGHRDRESLIEQLGPASPELVEAFESLEHP